MIFKQIKFQVIYKVGDDFRREDVSEMLCNPEYGVTSIKTITDAEMPFDPMSTALLQFTGMFDRDGAQIFHAHLLADDEGNIFEVVAYHGGFHLKQGEKPYELSEENCMKLRIIGDALRDAKLLMPESPEEIMRASTERRILPPIVSLKKKHD